MTLTSRPEVDDVPEVEDLEIGPEVSELGIEGRESIEVVAGRILVAAEVARFPEKVKDVSFDSLVPAKGGTLEAGLPEIASLLEAVTLQIPEA
ncbi:MAG: hypothetical protein KBB14_14890, partial [Thermoanaerobaculia bacterium]|nr:hypothetical protein [Thermoanaerobaculia bacterium]